MSTDQKETQEKQSQWSEQWSMFKDEERFLFLDWIKPLALDDFTDKDVLEAGCGGGQHSQFVSEKARHLTSIDLNTTDLARQRNKDAKNIDFKEDDIAKMDLKKQFDIVFCIGVIHHTDNPTLTFDNLYRHVKPGGRIIIWTYSSEGNFLVEYGVEPVRKVFLRKMSRRSLKFLSSAITAALYPIVHTIYRAPFLSFLPYFDYFRNFRKMTFNRNVLNVFDKLNAPQTHFTTLDMARQWMSEDRFEPESIAILPYAGVSYSLSGIKRA